MRTFGCVLLILLLSVTAVCQVPSSRCDAVNSPLAVCAYLTPDDSNSPANNQPAPTWASASASLFTEDSSNPSNVVPNKSVNALVSTPDNGAPKQGFRWGRALFECFTLLSIEQAYVVHDDWDWVAGKYSENGIPFNHYWRDYKQSLSAWVHSGWSDGDPNMYGYVGHPIQGVAVSYIYLQNDPKSENLEFSKTKAYWHSRFMATVWNAVYSTQWNLGPVSEVTVEKYGTHHRSPWNSDGSWPCNTNHCYTGVGQIDIVMTPLGGLGWLVGEDILDRYVARRVEHATPNRFLIDTTRIGLDPIRCGTNMLHGKRPWYRPRDANDVNLANQPKPLDPAISHGSAVGQSH